MATAWGLRFLLFFSLRCIRRRTLFSQPPVLFLRFPRRGDGKTGGVSVGCCCLSVNTPRRHRETSGNAPARGRAGTAVGVGHSGFSVWGRFCAGGRTVRSRAGLICLETKLIRWGSGGPFVVGQNYGKNKFSNKQKKSELFIAEFVFTYILYLVNEGMFQFF